MSMGDRVLFYVVVVSVCWLAGVAIVGGAVVPLLTGIIADVTGSLAIAFTLPMLCYAIIAAFGIYARKPA